MVISELKKNSYDILIAAGAVADFTPENVFSHKVSTDKVSKLTLTLKPTRKIIEEAKKVSPKTFVVGFKAEYNLSDEELADRAYERLVKSGIDLMVANDVGRENVGFRCETNEVLIVDKDRNVQKIPLARKEVIAKKVLDYILNKIGKT